MATDRRSAAGRRRSRIGAVTVIHLCAAVVVAVSAVAGRLPFLWFVDTLANRPSWVGLFVVWLVGTGLYLLAWHRIGRGNRPVEVLMTVAMLLSSVWGGYSLLVAFLQVTGLGVSSEIVFTLPWFLRLVAAAATLVAATAYIRLGRDADAAGDDDPLRQATPPPAALLVSAVGFVVCAYSLALLVPPQASQTQAVQAVRAATHDAVDTGGVVQFQNSLDDVVSKEAAVHPRDRWGTMRGFFSKGGKVVYDNTIQWGVLVVYRDQITCVARDVKTAEVVVRPGYCPG